MITNRRAFVAAMAVALLCALFFQDSMAQIKVPRINYKERALANGLKVISVKDASSPTVAIHVWYKVGAKDDPEGRSGFAHLFEHLMFKSTKNLVSEQMDRLTEDVGGFNNASTWDDFTNYYEVVPSNYLETLLWAEAERMSNLNVIEENFKSEREVVKEEFRQRILAPPYGYFFYMVEPNTFTTHPYKRPAIGSIEDLDAASLDDVRAFHKTFYRPDNATLIVVGDFEQQQLDAWVDKYFSKIVRPKTEIPRVKTVEPERTQEKRIVEYRPNVPFPALALVYLAPPANDADVPALKVAEAIMSDGESSRLYQSLVYEQQVAQEAFLTLDIREHQGLLALGAILAGEKGRSEDVERALLDQLDRMQDQLVSKAELDKAKNKLITSELQERETNDGKAFALAYAAVLLDKPDEVNKEIERLQAVTAEDVQRVMKKYFKTNNRVVIYYLPESMRENKGGKQ
jgi:zinc protease